MVPSMQLSLQLPQACAGLDNTLDTSSNTSSGSSSPTWLCSSVESGPSTPAATCNGQHSASKAAATEREPPRTAYRTLQLIVPGSPTVQADAGCVPTARRVLNGTSSYGDICDWLDQQVSKREGSKGRLVAACSHTCVHLDPALEPPTTPAQIEAVCDLPAPAFQLLGLL